MSKARVKPLPQSTFEAQVVTRFGQTCRIRDKHTGEFDCYLRKKLTPPPVTGDWVQWQRESESSAVITAVLPRKTVLERQDKTGRCKPLAANIDQLLIVSAFVEPSLSEAVIDGYLVVAENEGMDAVLLLNKEDLAVSSVSTREQMQTQVSAYRQLGYPVIECSALTGQGMTDIQACLKNKTSILVGQSGVGKSTLINHIIPDIDIATQPLSEGIHQGQHTTTASTLYVLATGGQVVDSPGIRRFTPFIKDKDYLDRGFKEINDCTGQCRFMNCAHQAEPDCAVQQALQEGAMSKKRFENYLTLLEQLHG